MVNGMNIELAITCHFYYSLKYTFIIYAGIIQKKSCLQPSLEQSRIIYRKQTMFPKNILQSILIGTYQHVSKNKNSQKKLDGSKRSNALGLH